MVKLLTFKFSYVGKYNCFPAGYRESGKHSQFFFTREYFSKNTDREGPTLIRKAD